MKDLCRNRHHKIQKAAEQQSSASQGSIVPWEVAACLLVLENLANGRSETYVKECPAAVVENLSM
jgi:hypothetical protein